jgi:NADPH:quinone reductase-like Zn-dependent oxidoreductase
MKAVRFHQYGGPEVLQYEDAPDPARKDGEVLVRVKACALNHLDIWERMGPPRVKVNLPHISGSDVSGIVESVPAGETELKVGDEIIVNPGLGCGRCDKCLSGMDNQCRYYGIIGNEVDGGYAELVSVPRRNVIPKPERMDFTQAASFPLVFLTAYHMLLTKARLLAGETVLVLGAGSGVGVAAIQIAKAHGANVIATASNDGKLKKAVELGADNTVNRTTQDVVQEVKNYTKGRGADVVVEHVGGATWEKSVKSVTKGGRIVTCGATTSYEATTDLRYIYSKEITIYGSFMGGAGEMFRVLELFKQRRLRPVVDREYALSEAAEAQTRMEKDEHFGKLVLKV